MLLFLAVSAYMTIKGLFAVGRAYGLDPVRFDVAALGAGTSDLPSVLTALGLGASIKAWVGFAVAGLLAA